MNIKQLKEEVDKLFSDRGTLMTLWQEIAENFYPQRADFTVRRTIGDDYMENLQTSFPVIVAREFSDQLETMLRPTAKPWFHIKPVDEDLETHEVKEWLQKAATIQRKAMYDRRSMFSRVSRETDADFGTFGQAAFTVRLNRARNGLLFRNWHLRDVVWKESDEGGYSLIASRQKKNRREMYRLWGDRCHSKIKEKLDTNPFEEFEIFHIMVESDYYDEDAKGRTYFSIYYDCQNKHIIEEVPVWTQEYVIPRWQTVSGSQYAYSPAAIAALPDARLIQAMTYTLLEAGEKAANPPVVATEDAVRSDVALYAGGLTWVDLEYDERLGDALRPLTQDFRGLPFGADMLRDSRAMIQQAFYLNRLRPFNPSTDPEMTAYQAGQLVQDWIRQALPLFSPMEIGYNGAMCEAVFDVLLRAGGFGPVDEVPSILHGHDVTFHFESPLHDAIEQAKGQKFVETKQLLAEAAAIDEGAIAMFDVHEALRDALGGIQTPEEWLRDPDEVDAILMAREQQMAQQQLLANLKEGSEVAKNLAGVEVPQE